VEGESLKQAGISFLQMLHSSDTKDPFVLPSARASVKVRIERATEKSWAGRVDGAADAQLDLAAVARFDNRHRSPCRGIGVFVALCAKMAACLLSICSPASMKFLSQDRETRICGS
jgi:hypothetical protein